MENYKELLGQDTVQFLLKNPALIRRLDFEVLEMNLKNLRRFGMSDETIRQSATQLLTWNPYDLLKRLEYIPSYPELAILSYNPQFGEILAAMETVTARLKAIQEADPRRVTFRNCTCSSLLYVWDEEIYYKPLSNGLFIDIIF